jgi:hypothetical protein
MNGAKREDQVRLTDRIPTLPYPASTLVTGVAEAADVPAREGDAPALAVGHHAHQDRNLAGKRERRRAAGVGRGFRLVAQVG